MQRRVFMQGGTAALAAVLSGCGGGGNGGGDLAEGEDLAAAISKKRKPPVPGAEIVQNPVFDSGLQSWSVQDPANSVLVPSELRAGMQALKVGSGVAWQRLLAGKLLPGKAYSLVVKARTLQPGAGEVYVQFRAADNEPFRTYRAAVASTAYSDVVVDFTVPVYSNVVDLVLNAGAGVPLVVDSASLKERAAIPRTEPVADTSYSHVPAGYTLAFNDEFNGTELNRKKWFTRYMWGGEQVDRLNDEQQRYRDNDNHRVEGGVLSLVAHKRTTDDPWGINYESGMIRSDWCAHYGYFEARVKMPGGRGVWPAFWIDADVAADGLKGWPPEIDFFEFVVTEDTEFRNMIHTGVVTTAEFPSSVLSAAAGWNEQWHYWTAPFNFNEGWHTIGCEWTPTSATTYVDGLKIVERTMNWVRPDGKLGGPAHILLNLAIGGSWAGRNGIDDSAFPQALQIDWVRAYQKAS